MMLTTKFYQKQILLFVFILVNTVYAQKPVEIIYHKNINDENKKPAKTIIFKDKVTYLSKKNAKNLEFIDYKLQSVVTMIKYENQYFKTVEKFEELPQPTLQKTTEKILGYACKKAIYKAFSNTIEVWFTTKTKAKGSPYKSYLPKNGLVLKIKVNGSLRLVATRIHKINKRKTLFYPLKKAQIISKPALRELQIKSRYTILSVFNKQQINYDPKLPKVSLDSSKITYRCSNGTIILKRIKLPQNVKKGSSVFAKLTNWSNGDAYDRTGSLFTVKEEKVTTILDAIKKGLQELPVFIGKDGKEYQGIVSTDSYEVPIELMRFFTSFGVSHFNHLREIKNYKWQDSVVYKQEITPLIPLDKKEIWLGVFIGNYDKGGHKVSLELDFYPSWDDEKTKNLKKYINPLFSTVNILEMSGQNYGRLFKTDTLTSEFYVPENVANLQLLYTVTGHGGWGRGDEFVPRLNEVYIDDERVFKFVPWRTDCGTYRFSNPASGNFKNGLSSSDLSRSNWCPATLTTPEFIPLSHLKPGKHIIKVVIHQGEDEGNSFNHWNVSGVLTGEKSKK